MKFHFKEFTETPKELMFAKATELFSMNIESDKIDDKTFKTIAKFEPPFTN